MASHDLATIDNPSAALTDFTLIVDLSGMSADWWTANDSSDGTKGRAFKADGTTELACDWIDFDNTGETGLLRVKWSGTFASSGTQQLWIEPPLAANDSVAANGTYGSDNAYVATDEGHYPIVGDSGSPVTDRTSNGETITWSDAQITVAADKLDFDSGSGGHPGADLMSSLPLDSVAGFTIAGLFTVDDVTADRGVFYTRSHANEVSDVVVFWMDNASPDHWGAIVQCVGDDSGVVYSDATPSASTVYHLVLTYGGSNLRLYIDGVEDTAGGFPATLTGNLLTTVDGNYRWGNPDGGAKDFDGQMQHMWVKSAGVSAAWAASENAQLTDNANFYTTWTWVPAGGASIVVLRRRRM